MMTVVLIRLVCDHCSAELEGQPGEGAQQLRARAKDLGWMVFTVGVNQQRDNCPACSDRRFQ